MSKPIPVPSPLGPSSGTRPSLTYVRFTLTLTDSRGSGLVIDVGDDGRTDLWVVLSTLGKGATFESLGKGGRWGRWRYNRSKTCILLSIGTADVFVLENVDTERPWPGQGGSGRYLRAPATDALVPEIHWLAEAPLTP